jgi:hypothetical protein
MYWMVTVLQLINYDYIHNFSHSHALESSAQENVFSEGGRSNCDLYRSPGGVGAVHVVRRQKSAVKYS